MKHEISRMRPVFDGDRYAGCLLRHARGWDALDVDGKLVGDYPAHLELAAVAKPNGTAPSLSERLPRIATLLRSHAQVGRV